MNQKVSRSKGDNMNDIEEIVRLCESIVKRLDKAKEAEEKFGIDSCLLLQSIQRSMARQCSEIKEINQLYGN